MLAQLSQQPVPKKKKPQFQPTKRVHSSSTGAGGGNAKHQSSSSTQQKHKENDVKPQQQKQRSKEKHGSSRSSGKSTNETTASSNRKALGDKTNRREAPQPTSPVSESENETRSTRQSSSQRSPTKESKASFSPLRDSHRRKQQQQQGGRSENNQDVPPRHAPVYAYDSSQKHTAARPEETDVPMAHSIPSHVNRTVGNNGVDPRTTAFLPQQQQPVNLGGASQPESYFQQPSAAPTQYTASSYGAVPLEQPKPLGAFQQPGSQINHFRERENHYFPTNSSLYSDSQKRSSGYEYARQGFSALDSIVTNGNEGTVLAKSAEEYERIIARLRAQFEELRNLRTTEAESALASARRTWEARISAQQSVLDHLRQELHDTKEELTAVRSHSRRGFSSKNNADYRVMEEQLENVKAENDELRRQLAEAEAHRVDQRQLRLQTECNKFYEILSNMHMEKHSRYEDTYIVTLKNTHPSIKFTLEYSWNHSTGMGEISYSPLVGTESLPEYLQEDIVFDEDQGPMFISRLVEAVFGPQ